MIRWTKSIYNVPNIRSTKDESYKMKHRFYTYCENVNVFGFKSEAYIVFSWHLFLFSILHFLGQRFQKDVEIA